MQVVIFENDEEFSNYLEQIIIETCHKLTLKTDDLNKLKRYLETALPSLFFIDIVMENRQNLPQGLIAARQIKQQNDAHLIVFITNYLNRIIGKTELQIASYNIIYKRSPRLDDQIATTISLANEHFENGSLIIRSRWETRYVPLSSIFFVEVIAYSDRVCVHELLGKHTYRSRLKDVLLQLDSRFVLAMKGIVVNKNRIARLDREQREIHFTNGETCPYSQAYAKIGGLL